LLLGSLLLGSLLLGSFLLGMRIVVARVRVVIAPCSGHGNTVADLVSQGSCAPVPLP
jgi:hypothetical protein